MKARLVTIAKLAAYPFFYLFCLGLFGYLTFPYDRLKDRLISEFDRVQHKRGSAAQRLEIDSLDSYWFTGVEVKGARLILPPSDDASRPSFDPAAKPEAPKPSVIEIEEAHARLSVLPLLLGRVRVTFWASVFGGEATGVVPIGKAAGEMELELSNIELGQVGPLVDTLGLPLAGTVNGKLSLEAPDGKYKKANGSLELTATDVAVGDGKTKIQGLIALPEAKLGELSISASAKDGVLKVEKLSANGTDLELAGDGKVSLREPWNNSSADLYVRFKFSDGYRNKNDLTKSLLGSPGSSMPALIEVQQPKMKRAKRADGFYGWHVHGQLKRLRFDPHAADSPASKGRGKESAFTGPAANGKKLGGLNLPLGPSEAIPSKGPKPHDEDDALPSPPPPAPPPPPPVEAPREEEPPTAAPANDTTPPGAPEPAPPGEGENAPPLEGDGVAPPER